MHCDHKFSFVTLGYNEIPSNYSLRLFKNNSYPYETDLLVIQ